MQVLYIEQIPMNRRKKGNQTLKARAKKANAKLSPQNKPKYISKADQVKLAAEFTQDTSFVSEKWFKHLSIVNRPITKPVNAMDYEFTLDEYDRPIAEFSSGFEAIGRWFSEQLSDEHAIAELFSIVEQLEQKRISRRLLFSADSHLLLTQDDAEVKALALDGEVEEELPEDTRLYDDEAYASCGLPDFKQALIAWEKFINA